jgi:uncharacterized protein (DUF362 family)
MGSVSDIVKDIPIPRMIPVRQRFDSLHIPKDQIASVVQEQLRQGKFRKLLHPGMRIAVGVGSRGICNYEIVVREMVRFLKEEKTEPFIVAAMGSHGGATEKGLRDILVSYGITEETMDCPLRITPEAVQICETEEGQSVFIDKYAAAADGIVVANRIKAHTAFRGPFESGLMKILTIGLGKQKGASYCHAKGFKYMAHHIPLFGKAIIKHGNVLFGIGLIENCYDQTREIIALRGDEFEQKEPDLLLRAKSNMPKIHLDSFDVLLVDEAGKNISGDGMDPNLTGKFCTHYASGGVEIQHLALLDLTDESHGNASGWGMASYTTERAFSKFDRETTYPNALTSNVPQVTKVPMVMKNDKECIQAAILTCEDIDFAKVKLVHIKNTLSVDIIDVSEALREEVEKHPDMEIIGEPKEFVFDGNGNLF